MKLEAVIPVRSIRSLARQCGLIAFTAVSLLYSATTFAQVNLANAPLLTLKTAPGLVMLTMGRDLPLFKAAYSDVSDLDGDGVLDLFFKPAFKYEGYFASDRCYDYIAASGIFRPIRIGDLVIPNAADTSKNYYRCTGTPTATGKWSGNFLNWVAMSRMDVLRKVLYGGRRSTDAATTVLERAFVPQDSTLWGKEYGGIANDGYDIREYTPLALPTGTTRHMFANVSLQRAPADRSARFAITLNPPAMIVYQNRPGRIWDLVAQERPILGQNPGVNPGQSSTEGTSIVQYIVRVESCVLLSSKYEDWCTQYGSGGTASFKPTGLLHKYGEAKTLAFGLISGTFDNNYVGGVLRQNVDDFTREVDQTNGRFITAAKGIVSQINAFRPWGFGGGGSSPSGYDWGCGAFERIASNGECGAWGNPLGEMMFEGLRYFSASAPSSAFTANVGSATNSPEKSTTLDWQRPAWINPYVSSTSRRNTAAYPICARPVQMTIGDPKTSFDSDHLPGSAFSVGANMGSTTVSTLGSLNVGNEADAIWASEFGAGQTRRFFVGQSGNDSDGNPSAKTVNSFKNIRGHAPDSTTNEGSFYGASVARYGKFTGLSNPAVPASQELRVDQISIALDSNIPQIKIPLPNGRTISMVLLSKSVSGGSISNSRGAYQQTGAITGFFVDRIANTTLANTDSTINGGRPYFNFRVSFSDVDQGNDNESDGKVTYEIKVLSTNQISVGVDFFAQSTFVGMHVGYVMNGTTADGVYLDVGRNVTKGYFLDTLPGAAPGSAMTGATGPAFTNIQGRLGSSTLVAPRVFTAGAGSNGGFIPNDMLWYAAKYGGASKNVTGGFDFKLKPNGEPENYFFASNPSKLSEQLGQAFQKAAALSGATSSAVSGNGVRIGGASFVYQADYDTVRWGGDINAYPVDANGNVSNTPAWKASTSLPQPSARNIVLGRGGTDEVAINVNSFSSLSAQEKTAFIDDNTFRYLLGVRTSEQSTPGGQLRTRSSAVGDIVNSDPLFIDSADFGYSDASYQTFKTSSAPQLVGFGSNNGFYQLISSTNGVEKLAFIPLAARDRMSKLADPGYDHEYFVDGPGAFGHVKLVTGATPWRSVVAASMGAGGKSVFAIDVTSPTLSATSMLWEYGTDIDLGNVINKPIVGMLENGTTPVVIVGNGLNSAYNRAALVVINAATGANVMTCKPPNSVNPINNGLAAISFVSLNNNGKISYVYGGDYKGNVWRFDPNIAGCDIQRVFTAQIGSSPPQPITGELTVIKAPASKPGYMVLFGTGSYLTTTDASNTDVQSLYGIWDDLGTTAVTRTNLNSQSILSTATVAGTRKTSIASTPWFEEPASSNKKGWFLDMSCADKSVCPDGERTVAKPTLLGSGATQRVFFLSFVPGTDACKPGGGGWLTSFDPLSGNYIKGFATIDSNSTFIPGVTPRGLFVTERTRTANNPTTAILFVSVNVTNNAAPTPKGAVSTGGIKIGADGAGTGIVGLDVSPPITALPGFGTRRQVWRQIQ